MQQMAAPFPDTPPSNRGQSLARFGHLSRHAFFTRHNPHPTRVKHIKGLLDHPICFVDDSDFIPTPRSFYTFPPNSYNDSQVRSYPIPVSTVNLGTGNVPIDTLTGLQRFTGLQNYPYREKAIPNVGLVPITEGWREELRQMTRNIALGRNLLDPAPQPQPVNQRTTPSSPRKTQYSAVTGRIMPSSRNSTGQKSRRFHFGSEIDRMIEETDIESKVFVMICQLLQADDINSVKAWLMSAGEREKAIVVDLLHRALAAQADTQYEQYVAEPPRRPLTEEDNQNGEKLVERLTIADGRVSRERRPAASQENGFLPPIEEQDKRPSTTTKSIVPFSRQSLRVNAASRNGYETRLGTCEEEKVWNPLASVA